MNGNFNSEHMAQINYGRKMNATDRFSGQANTNRYPIARRVSEVDNKQNSDKGHMGFLRGLKDKQATVRCLTVLNTVHVGIVKAFDEDTISLKVPKPTAENADAYENRVFFKQNLVEFSPVIQGVDL